MYISYANKQRGSAHLGAVIVLAVLLIGVIGFLFVQNFTSKDGTGKSQEQSTELTKAEKDESSWATCINDNLKYEFKHPTDWFYYGYENSMAGGEELGRATAEAFKEGKCRDIGGMMPGGLVEKLYDKYGETAKKRVLSYGELTTKSLKFDNIQAALKYLEEIYGLSKGHDPKPSKFMKINGMDAVFYNQKTSETNNEFYVIKISDEHYIDFTYRRSDFNYHPPNNKYLPNDFNDFSSYEPVVKKIINSIRAIE